MSGVARRRKVADGVHIYFGKGSIVSSDNAEPCEVNNYPCEIEFLCVEDDSCLPYTDDKVTGSPPVRL